MKIQTGLFDHNVIQRTFANISDATITGQAVAAGPIIAHVLIEGRVVPNFDRVPIGQSAGGKFTAKIAGLPAGGPYTIELSIDNSPGETVIVSDVLVGDVWLLAGQSNMQGCGLIKYASPPSDAVRAFQMDDRWAVAQDPLHNLWQAIDPVHTDLNGGVPHSPAVDTGCGPGVAFGQQMHRSTGVPQGLIACAHGGTSMQQWNPKLRASEGKSLYGALLRRFRKNGGRVAGIVWYQGESDANADAHEQYSQRMVELVAALREDMGIQNLPIALVQISRVVGWEAGVAKYWNAIQESQRKLPEVIDRCAVVPAIDLPLDDAIHIGGSGNNRLGKRLAGAMSSLIAKGQAPIALKSAALQTDPRNKLGQIIVEFDNVEGVLQTGGPRPVGFAIVDSKSGWRDVIYHTDLDANRAIIHLTVPPAQVHEMSLYYGFGMDPVCNITDQGDRSLPVFGPISLRSTLRT